ncbi:hypothetical protein [Amycolatopsis sp. YIM 10]|uniref:hypothetical protein n=1 Tax=Amycolatopsis sp. YIM 10 TaxID=2653857 RepID=UPI00129066E3|nr:hypothetical protein [Amycolatopsis sp. YIM 10]QFU89714.1 hypothetical protein YIM_22685 [Amycolatopsis sp. YIM 10]
MSDYRELGERLLAPVRTGLPVELTGDPRRGFRRPVKCGECTGWGEVDVVFDGYERFGCPACQCTGNDPAAPVDDFPADVHRVALGDCPSFLLAEQHARETAACLAPWGITPPQRVVWRVGHVSNATVGSYSRDLFPRAAHKAIADLLDRRWAAELADLDRDLGLGAWGDDPGSRLAEVRVAGRAVAQVPNPYGPVLDVWRTGFGLEAITGHEILLYAPGP